MAQLQYFLGANSPAGFYSLYHELLPAPKAQAVYILKGGAGCGKSSLMRDLAGDGLFGDLVGVRFRRIAAGGQR